MDTDGMDMRAGARYAVVYTLRIILLYAIVAVVCVMFLGEFSHMTDGGSASNDTGGSGNSGFDYTPWVLRFTLPVLLVMPMAFMAGCYRPGDRRRLLWRAVVNVYMVAAIFVIAGDASYTADRVSLGSSGAWAEDMTLHVDTDLLLAVLMLVPLISVADAFLEYREGS